QRPQHDRPVRVRPPLELSHAAEPSPPAAVRPAGSAPPPLLRLSHRERIRNQRRKRGRGDKGVKVISYGSSATERRLWITKRLASMLSWSTRRTKSRCSFARKKMK